MYSDHNYNKINNDRTRILQLEAELADTKRQLDETSSKLSILLDNMPGGVLSYDADTGKLDFISQGCLDIFHCTENQLREHFYNNFELMVHKTDRPRVKQQVKDQLDFFTTVDLTYQTEDLYGNLLWIYHRARLVTNPDGSRKFYAVISDITEEKLVQNQMQLATMKLKEKTELDPMTGLFNKVSMENAITELLQTSTPDVCHAMLMIDTDNFKSVNDTFGHQYGDKVILFVAESIKSIFRESDYVARMGGDEFMVFMKRTTALITIERAKQLNRTIKKTLEHNGKSVKISCSIGISFFNANGTTYKDLYKAADQALYVAKENGKDQFRTSK